MIWIPKALFKAIAFRAHCRPSTVRLYLQVCATEIKPLRTVYTSWSKSDRIRDCWHICCNIIEFVSCAQTKMTPYTPTILVWLLIYCCRLYWTRCTSTSLVFASFWSVTSSPTRRRRCVRQKSIIRRLSFQRPSSSPLPPTRTNWYDLGCIATITCTICSVYSVLPFVRLSKAIHLLTAGPVCTNAR